MNFGKPGNRKHSSPFRPWLIALLLVSAASLVVTVSAVSWSSALANGTTGGTGTGGTGTGGTGGTGGQGFGPGFHLIDEDGLPAVTVTLDSVGASVPLTVHANGLNGEEADTVQLFFSHDPRITAITNATCTGAFDSAFSPGDAVVLDDGSGSVFTCFQSTAVSGDLGAVVEFDLERVGFGADEVALSGDGQFPTMLFWSGHERPLDLPDPITVVDLVALTPTSTPVATATSAPPAPPPPTTVPPPPAAQVPGVPLNVETEPGDGTAIIRWEPPANQGSSPILFYTVGIVGQPVVQELPPSARSTVFGGLTNGETIQLRVRASSAAGTGPYSAGVDVTPAGPPDPPGSVTADLLDDNASIEVEWVAPEFTNGADIDLFTIAEVNSALDPVDVAGDVTSYLFEDLDPGVYSFTVIATSTGGSSVPSEATDQVEVPVMDTSGAPEEPGAGGSTLRPSVELSDSEVEQLAQSFGQGAQVSASKKAELSGSGSALSLLLPVDSRDSPEVTGASLDFSSNTLRLNFQDGSGTFAMTLSDQSEVNGSGSIRLVTGQVAIAIESLSLEFKPLTPMSQGEPAGNIKFEVDLTDVPGTGNLVATVLDSFNDLDIPAGVQLVNPLSPDGALFGSSADDLALLVTVQLEDLDPELFGRNTVTIEADPGWIAAHRVAAHQIILFKITDAGLVYASEASCEPGDSGNSVCTALFDGDAAGFSSFGLIASQRQPTPTSAPVIDVATPTPQPTATPVPPTATATPSPTPEPTATPAPSATPPAETPTVAPLITPTPPLDLGSGGGNSTLPILIGAVVVGVILLILGAIPLIRRRSGSMIGLLLISILATQVFNDSTGFVGAVDLNPQPHSERPRLDGSLTWLNEAGFGGSAIRNSVSQAPASPFVPLFPSTQDGLVRISALSTAPDLLLAEMELIGMQGGFVSGTTVSGRLPLAAIPLLNSLDHLTSIRTDGATSSNGLTVTQGDVAHNIDDARSDFGLDGTGLTIAVISDSYDCLGGAAADIANGDLPATGVIKVSSPDSCDGMIDEGRAMLQIIHDIAPGAELMFASGFNGEIDMSDKINGLRGQADIIVDDISYFAEPYFQDGVIARAVDNVADSNVVYVSSAGNAGEQSYEDDYRTGPTFPIDTFPSDFGAPRFFGGTAHDFDPGPGVDWLQEVIVQPGLLTIVFQWDDNFLSLWNGNGPGFLPAESELDIYLFDETGSVVVGGSTILSQGADPVEVVQLINTGPPTTANLAIFHDGGPVPGRLKYIHLTPMVTQEFGTTSPTIFGHSNAEGGIAVGAADYRKTPEFGVTPPEQESFTSVGGLAIRRDFSGSPIEPIIRPKPDIVAADGVNTTFFGADVEGDGFPNFFGTSASAPHVAAIAALILQADPTLSNEDVRTILKSSAIEMAEPGFDFHTGSGFVDAHTALSFLGEPFEVLHFPWEVTDLVMESNERFAWVGIRGQYPSFETGILKLDTETGDVVTEWETSFKPTRIALSDDYSVIYAGEKGSPIIKRFDTATGVENMTIDLGMEGTNTFYYPKDMAVKPGDPDVLVVALGADSNFSSGHGAVAYATGVKLPIETTGFNGITDVEFITDSTLYGHNGSDTGHTLYLLQLNENGIIQTDSAPRVMSKFGEDVMKQDGGLVFGGGVILDPSTWPPTQIGTISGQGAFEPDVSANRAYFVDDVSSQAAIEITIIDLATRQPVDSIKLEGAEFAIEPDNLHRWGDSGLVFFESFDEQFVTGEGLFLFKSRLTSTSISVLEFSESALDFSAMTGGGTQTRQLTLTNNGPEPVQIGEPNISGEDWELFRVNYDECGSTVLSDDPGQNSCNMEVSFTPAVAGDFTADLHIVSDALGSVRTVRLNGIGVEALAANSITVLNLETNDLIHDPVSNSLFASINALEGNFGNSVLQIDPVSGLVITEYETGPRSDALAISDDGHKLYIGVIEEGKLKRLNLVTGQMEFETDLGTTGSPPVVVSPLDLEVVPGDSSSVVVSNRWHDDLTFEEVAVYKDGVKLPDVIDTHSGPGRITFSDSPDLLYGFNVASTGWEFFRITTDSNGVTEIDRTEQLLRDFREDIHFEDGLVYSPKGRIIDPTVPEIVDEFPGFAHPTGGPVRPEARDGKVYYLLNVGGDERGGEWSDGVWEIAIFDIDTLERIGTVPVGVLNEEPLGDVGVGDLVRWGIDGLAFRTNRGELYLIRSDEIGSEPVEVTGQVHLMGRLDLQEPVPDGQGTITSIDQFGGTTSGPINVDGSFSLEVLPGPQRFRLDVDGFLSAESGLISVDGPVALNSVTLIAGDTNGDNILDATDAENIASAFGSFLDPSDELSDGDGNLVDIDWDGAITGRDASLLIRNLGTTGPLPWFAVDP